MLYGAVEHRPSLRRRAFHLFMEWGELSELMKLHTLWAKDILRWIQKEASANYFCTLAVHLNQPAILVWLHSIGFPLSINAYKAAESLENQEIIAWLIQNGCPVPEPGEV